MHSFADFGASQPKTIPAKKIEKVAAKKIQKHAWKGKTFPDKSFATPKATSWSS